MKTYDMLASAFVQEGVEEVFALLGDANMHWATRLAENAQMTYVRHEHAAVAGAMGYARASGRTGVATVTCGPGLTQVMTALTIAVRASIPLVVFAGEAPIKKQWYNQGIDQRPFVEACGAEYIPLHHPDRMLIEIRDAFLRARSNRKPIVLGVPFDLQVADWTGPSELPEPAHSFYQAPALPEPNADEITRLSKLIDQAKRPVVLTGLGAVHAVEACRDLAEKAGALLATTLPARGLFAGDEFELGLAGGFSNEAAREIFQEADLLIGFGTSFASHAADGGKLYPNATIIQVDLDPQYRNQGRTSAHHLLRADANAAAKALTSTLSPRPNWRTPDMKARLAEAKQPAIPTGDTLSPQAVVAALDDVLPKDWFCVNSSGHCSYFFASMFGRKQDNFLTIREFGAIGNGTSYAIGAARARPNQKIVLFDGDGSLLMHLQELETMIRHDMNILIVVMNDGAYGSEIHKLRGDGLSDEGAVFGRPDFAEMARGMGAKGTVFKDISDLQDHLGDAKKPGLCVWDFHIDDEIASPQILRVHPPKGKS